MHGQAKAHCVDDEITLTAEVALLFCMLFLLQGVSKRSQERQHLCLCACECVWQLWNSLLHPHKPTTCSCFKGLHALRSNSFKLCYISTINHTLRFISWTNWNKIVIGVKKVFFGGDFSFLYLIPVGQKSTSVKSICSISFKIFNLVRVTGMLTQSWWTGAEVFSVLPTKGPTGLRSGLCSCQSSTLILFCHNLVGCKFSKINLF